MVAEGRHINVYLALVPVDVLLCPFIAAPCKDNPGITSDADELRKTHVALEAEKHERPGSSELACIGDTKAQIFLSDKDTYEKVVYSNTALFHLQARVYRARIATRLQSTTSIITTTTSNHLSLPFPASLSVGYGRRMRSQWGCDCDSQDDAAAGSRHVTSNPQAT